MKKYLVSLLALVFIACASNQNNEKIIKDGEYRIDCILDTKSGVCEQNTGGWVFFLDKNKFIIYVGCNKLFADTKQKNAKLFFNNLASTKMMCFKREVMLEKLLLDSLDELSLEHENILGNDKIKIKFGSN